MNHRTLGFLFASSLVGLTACGGTNVPSAAGTRGSGQSKLMDRTVAGQCTPKTHERPFIIEWDATDMSSFESYAANDVVFVKYEGCDLQVLDRCRNDSVRGSNGAYKPVEWTSGSLEKIDIADSNELTAKLPLGVATLGGRVSAGEKFHMEYYVAGTRTATRDAVYRKDIEKLPGCSGATHFVYAYNLGAFALGSAAEVNAEVNASAFGFGANGNHASSQSADKKGGDLSVCKSDSAKEVDGCKAPVRLTLREVSSTDNPDIAASTTPDTDASLNAAGKLASKLDMSDDARAHYDAAGQKLASRDGKGCLKELDAHDKADAKHASTDPKSGIGHMRGQCLMLAGQCDPGKQLVRKSFQASQGATMGSEQIDKVVDAFAGQYCQGSSLAPRDQLLKALSDLQQGAFMSKKDVPFCSAALQSAKKLIPVVKPKDDDDTQIVNAGKAIYVSGPQCFAKAGDCDAAYKAFQGVYPPESLAKVKDAAQKEQIIRASFEAIVSKCKK